MDWSPISKPRGSLPREPNLVDYDAARRQFTWDEARAQIEGLPGGGLNIAHEAVFRHLAGPRADQVAIRFLAQGQPDVERTYRELALDARRFASVLGRLGIVRGERVASLLGRIPALYCGCRLLSVVLGIRARTGQDATVTRIDTRAGHDRPAVSTQGRADPRRVARPAARADRANTGCG
jgi:acyl-coenzyme A synthetase/AMP-(fatty) acid ligase